MRRLFSWTAFLVTAIYPELGIVLLIRASQTSDAEGVTAAWLILGTPWIWIVGGLGSIVGNSGAAYFAIALNAGRKIKAKANTGKKARATRCRIFESAVTRAVLLAGRLPNRDREGAGCGLQQRDSPRRRR